MWEALERHWQPPQRQRPSAGPRTGALHLAQAQSNEGPRGRKKDLPDAERLVKRLVADELTLSFVPDVTQRLWRTVTRRKYQLTCNRVQLQNRLPARLTRPRVGRIPTRLLADAGERIDWPVSLPVPSTPKFAAIDAPVPPLDPPGVRVRS